MIENIICEANQCTGCGACAAICPKSSIELKVNKIGAIQPVINSSTCINCNACRKICPTINVKELQFNKAIDAYYATSNDIDFYTNASSGGIATTLAYKVLEEGGIVYASMMLSLIHI